MPGDEFLEQILVIAADQNQLIPLHQCQDELLHLQGLFSPIEKIPQQNQLMGFAVLKISRLPQGLLQLSTKAVNVRDYI